MLRDGVQEARERARGRSHPEAGVRFGVRAGVVAWAVDGEPADHHGVGGAPHRHGPAAAWPQAEEDVRVLQRWRDVQCRDRFHGLERQLLLAGEDLGAQSRSGEETAPNARDGGGPGRPRLDPPGMVDLPRQTLLANLTQHRCSENQVPAIVSVRLRQQQTGDRNQARDHPFSWVLGAARRHDDSLAYRAVSGCVPDPRDA
jgi:hypothetical protein